MNEHKTEYIGGLDQNNGLDQFSWCFSKAYFNSRFWHGKVKKFCILSLCSATSLLPLLTFTSGFSSIGDLPLIPPFLAPSHSLLPDPQVNLTFLFWLNQDNSLTFCGCCSVPTNLWASHLHLSFYNSQCLPIAQLLPYFIYRSKTQSRAQASWIFSLSSPISVELDKEW